MIVETRLIISMANLYILWYIYMLKKNKCDCSEDWKRDFIFYFSLFYIFSIISFLLFPEVFYQNLQLVILSKVILGLLLLVNIYCLYTYSQKLDSEECECADDFGQHFMKAFSFFYVVVILLVFAYLVHYYVRGEYKNIKKIKRLHGRFSDNNLEKIIIVNKIN